MPYIQDESDTARNLEAAIDAHGLDNALDCIARICAAKAEHLGSNWGDATTARLWDKAGGAILKAAAADAIEAVS